MNSAEQQSEFIKSTVLLLLTAIDAGIRQSAHILWSVVVSLLTNNWLLVMIIFFVVFIIATAKAMIGRWGMLGSVLYNLLYFGILFTIGLVYGPGVFVSDYFNFACTTVLYPVCYLAVGLILKRVKVLNYR